MGWERNQEEEDMEYYLALQKKEILSFVTAWRTWKTISKLYSKRQIPHDLASAWKRKMSSSWKQKAEGPFSQRWKVRSV